MTCPIPKDVEKPQRCVIVLDRALPPGNAASAAAVIALTIGQRHPRLVGEPSIDACRIAVSPPPGSVYQEATVYRHRCKI